MWGDYDRMHDGYGFGWFALLVLLLVLVGLAVTLLVVLLRNPGRAGAADSPTGSPATWETSPTRCTSGTSPSSSCWGR